MRKNLDEFYARLQMHKIAWISALECLDDHGAVVDNFEKKRIAFSRRKACGDFEKEECDAAFDLALRIGQAMNQYVRTNVGASQPNVVRWYEHLYQMAKALRDEFPEAPDILIASACTALESRWHR